MASSRHATQSSTRCRAARRYSIRDLADCRKTGFSRIRKFSCAILPPMPPDEGNCVNSGTTGNFRILSPTRCQRNVPNGQVPVLGCCKRLYPGRPAFGKLPARSPPGSTIRLDRCQPAEGPDGCLLPLPGTQRQGRADLDRALGQDVSWITVDCLNVSRRRGCRSWFG